MGQTMIDLSLFSVISNVHPVRADKPDQVIAYQNLTEEEKIITSTRFFAQERIKRYFNDKWRAELHNRKWFQILYEVYEQKSVYVPQLNDHELKIIVQQLSRFKQAIFDQNDPYPALMIDFEKYPFNEDMRKDIKGVEIDRGDWTD